MTLRDEILSLDDLESRIVTIPAWKNKKILVQSLTGSERNRMFRLAVDRNNKLDEDKLYALLIIFSSRDPKTNELIFKPEDAKALVTKNTAAIELLAKTAIELSGLGEGEIRKAEKN